MTITAWKKGALAGAGLLALAALAEPSYWQGTAGGDLANGAWSPSLTQDRNYFNAAQSGPLTLSADFDGLYWPWFGVAGNFALDLGGHVLTVGYRTHFDGGAGGSSLLRVTIGNGTYAVRAGGGQIFIGDGKGYNHVSVGAGGVLRGSTTSPIYVGDKTYWNTLLVQDGGRLEGQVSLANSKGGNNALICDGVPSRWSYAGTGRTIVGDKGANNTVTLRNGAQATLGGSLDMAYNATSSGNKVTVGYGSSLTVSGEVNVGYNGPSNEISVEAGGRLVATCPSAVYVGRQGSASGNALTVAGTVQSDVANTSTTPIWYVGANTANNLLRILPGGQVDLANANLYLANAAVAADNRAEVLGGELAAKRIIVGLKGTDCSLWVSNGVVRVSETLDFSYDTGAARGNLVIEGRDTAVTVGSSIRLRKDSVLTFRVPREGFAAVPLTVNNLEAESDAKLVVTFADGRPPRRDVQLIASVQDLSEPSVQRLRQKLVLPERARLVFTERAVTLRMPRGLVFSVR